jgi:hypothetical protein
MDRSFTKITLLALRRIQPLNDIRNDVIHMLDADGALGSETKGTDLSEMCRISQRISVRLVAPNIWHKSVSFRSDTNGIY